MATNDTTRGAAPPLRGRPPVEAVDLDRANRPGVPKERPPQPWPNSRPVPERMTARPSVPRHGRPGKPMPPVYGTAVPLRGVSGAIRAAAYRLPDHVTNHWTLLMLADGVEAWGRRARRLLWLAVPAVALVLVARTLARESGGRLGGLRALRAG
jgi:hypothetical protein